MSKSKIKKGFISKGKNYFFRTITYHMVGKAEEIKGNFVKLSTASWIADSGRFTQCIKDGQVSESEPVGEAYINLDTVTDFFPWAHTLPTEQK